jgi:hypothetical protein
MAGLLDLFGQAARLQIALDAQAMRNGKGIGGRRMGDRPAAPQRHHPELPEGALIEAYELGLSGMRAHAALSLDQAK